MSTGERGDFRIGCAECDETLASVMKREGGETRIHHECLVCQPAFNRQDYVALLGGGGPWRSRTGAERRESSPR
jgi:hypothetical protein